MTSINRKLLEQTSFDSARPSGASVVVHRIHRQGRYRLSMRGARDEVVETRGITVEMAQPDGGDRADGPPPAGAPTLPTTVAVDLEDATPVAGRRRRADIQEQLRLGAGGYASFSAPAGRAHRFVLTRLTATGEPEEDEFDSERLRADDAFAVTLLRPGTYAMKDTIGGHEGRITVSYPQVGDEPYRPADPVDVECGDGALRPGEVQIGPAQGVVFRAVGDCHITVELVDPDDGPGERGRRPVLRRPGRRPRPLPGRRPRPRPRPGRGGG